MRRLLLLLFALTLSAPSLAGPIKPLVTKDGQTRQLPAGDTLQTSAPTTSAASINLPHGVAPTNPVDGDCWTTSSVGLTCRINGANVSQSPLTAANASATFDAAYCNTVGRQIVRQTGAWTCAKGIPADPTWWGADATGVADSTAATASAYAAAGYVRFPPGKFRFNSASTFTVSGALGSLKLEGSGADVTQFYFPGTGGWTFQLSSQGQSVHLADFSITTGGQNQGNAITIQNSAPFIGTFVAQSDITRVTCRGNDGYGVVNYWSTCFSVVATTDVTFDGINAYGDSTALHGTGISITAPSGGPTVNCISASPVCGTTYLISKSNLSFLGVGLMLGSNTQSVSVDTSFIAQVENGIVVASGARTLQGLNITNLHCFAYRRCLFAQASQSNLQVIGGYMNVSGAGFYTIDVPAAQMTFSGITFFPRDSANPVGSGGIAIRAATSTCGVAGTADCTGPTAITGNTFTSIGTALLLDSGTSMITVGADNGYNSNTTNVSDLGSGNFVGSLVTTSAGRMGYSTGAGGSVVQATSKSTAVTLNRPTGWITTNNASLAAGAEIAFNLNSSAIKTNDMLYVQAGNGNYGVRATDCAFNVCTIRLKNTTAGALGDAVAIGYAVIGGSQN